MISNQPQAVPQNRASETRTPLNAVFRRLSDTPIPAAASAAPRQPEQPAAPRAAVAEPAPAASSAPAASAIAAEPAMSTQMKAAEEPIPTQTRPSPAAAVLARASAAMAVHPPSEPAPRASAAPPGAAELEASNTPGSKPVAPLAESAMRGKPPAPPPEAAQTPSFEPTSRQRPAAWAVPPWLVAPVLALAIPDSPFGWGAAPGTTLAPAPGGAVPVTIGFATAMRAAAAPAPSDAIAAARPLPRSAGEFRPWARQLRAERPLGAPQTAPRAPAAPGAASLPAIFPPAGLPVAELPAVIVEPRVMSAEEQAHRPDNRPAMRNRRLYRRVRLDAEFEIDGAPAQLLDLSMGGFAAANAPRLAPDAIVPATVRLSIDGVDIGTRMRARMIYTKGPRSGGRFIDLTASQTAFLRYVVTWRGRSVGALGTTTLLDAITRWPEHGHPAAAPQPAERQQKTPWWSRWFGRLLGPRRNSRSLPQ